MRESIIRMGFPAIEKCQRQNSYLVSNLATGQTQIDRSYLSRQFSEDIIRMFFAFSCSIFKSSQSSKVQFSRASAFVPVGINDNEPNLTAIRRVSGKLDMFFAHPQNE